MWSIWTLSRKRYSDCRLSASAPVLVRASGRDKGIGQPLILCLMAKAMDLVPYCVAVPDVLLILSRTAWHDVISSSHLAVPLGNL